MRISDWPSTVTAVTAADEARLWDQAAEEALDQAVDIAGTRRDATEHALIGIGMALRSTGARLDALTDELANLADILAAPRPARRPWWRCLTDRLTSGFAGRRCGEACPDDPDGDVDGEGLDDADDLGPAAAPGVATVTPLRRTEARS
ncbi:hypothetical protein [Actinomadura sp. 9N215]|uniref:hypothetical protein n=1 Tax=Actinomadura sp. 9N215 TaxID=3375150 RepID=UPI0037887E64